MTGDNDLKKLRNELKEKKALITDLENEIKEINEKLEDKEKELENKDEELMENENKLAEYLSHLQRLQADFENYKKHNAKKQEDIVKYANEGLILKLLDVYQDFERAMEKCETAEDLQEGLKIIYKKLKEILENEGLKEIPCAGEKFDPFKHEALMAEKHQDFENGMVIEELAKGYTLKDKVIKYSMVKVCKK
ncbi:MAG: nucleotide exchange factor GrpE [Methanomicrobiales archaeon]